MATSRYKPNPNQIPMFPPSSSWVRPAEPPNLSDAREVVFDTETDDRHLSMNLGPGWFDHIGHVAGISLAWEGGAVYLPVAHPDSDNFNHGGLGDYLKQLFRQSQTRFIAHHAAYDVGWLKSEWGIEPPEILDDTMAMAAIVDETQTSYSLDNLCKARGIPGKDETLLRDAARTFGFPGKGAEVIARLPARYAGPYAEQDGRATQGLYHKLLPILEAEGTYNAYRLEADLIPLTVEMRRRGIRVNLDAVDRAARALEDKSQELLNEVARETGGIVSIKDVRSPAWMARTFQQLGIYYPSTELGAPSFEASWMKKSEHKVPRLIARAKQYRDAADKFLRNYIIKYSWKGRIHATINQFKSEDGGARSHRVSYADPPLQQTPSRDEDIAPLVRGAFQPEEGELWCADDYSQQEYRLIVDTAETLERMEPEAKQRLGRRLRTNIVIQGAIDTGDEYRRNPSVDFHDWVAEITRLKRRRAKDVNFAKAFGAGVPQFALMTGMSQSEAAAVMRQYDQKLPFVYQTAAIINKIAADQGYIRMLDGARSHYPTWEASDWNGKEMRTYLALPDNRGGMPCSYEEAIERVRDPRHPWYGQVRRAFTHKAFNHRIQGSAARMMKRAMLGCWRAGYVPMIQMHDELGFSVNNPNTGREVAEIMRTAIPTQIPMKIDVEYGVTWGRAAKVNGGYQATYDEAMAELK